MCAAPHIVRVSPTIRQDQLLGVVANHLRARAHRLHLRFRIGGLELRLMLGLLGRPPGHLVRRHLPFRRGVLLLLRGLRPHPCGLLQDLHELGPSFLHPLALSLIHLLQDNLHLLSAGILHLLLLLPTALLCCLSLPLRSGRHTSGILLILLPDLVFRLQHLGCIMLSLLLGLKQQLGLLLIIGLEVLMVLLLTLLQLLDAKLLLFLPGFRALLRLKALVEDPRLLPFLPLLTLGLGAQLLCHSLPTLLCHVGGDDDLLLLNHLRHRGGGGPGIPGLLQVSLIVLPGLLRLIRDGVLDLSLPGADEVLGQLGRLPFHQGIPR
mmetsp:Transcript_101099/g.240961  ORF Transcript_101099/g.240961 Transcript_101099/m.240961 type:complete len:322 (-) Transcript_101099:128-1093(-)